MAKLLVGVLENYGIDVEPVWLPGQTRLAKRHRRDRARAPQSRHDRRAAGDGGRCRTVAGAAGRTSAGGKLGRRGRFAAAGHARLFLQNGDRKRFHAAGKPVLLDATGAAARGDERDRRSSS